MHRSVRIFATILCLAGLARFAHATDPSGGTGGGPLDGTLLVRVIHDGTTDPFPGAFVMVGQASGDPFAGNYGFTDATGMIVFTDPALIGPITVTAGAADHRYLSLVDVDANDIVLPLSPILPAGPNYEVGDFVSGIDVDNGPFHAGDGNVDMAFVLPAMNLGDLISFDMANLLGPPEIINILGNQFEVPSNFFIPQQWELFVEIIKDHYYLYLPTGSYTLAAMSGRIPNDVLLGGGEIGDLLPAFQWREIDILNIDVTGNTYAADLTVDPDLIQTVTLNLANIPDGSLAYCISAGDLDNRTGLGRLIPMGINSLNCPAGSGPCAGGISLTTTAAAGEFAGMAYFPVVAVDMINTDDMLVVVDRNAHAQNYSANMSSFFEQLDLSYADANFSWNDVASPVNGSPDVHVQISRISDTISDAVYWELMSPSGTLGLTPPALPIEAPFDLVDGVDYVWEQVALGLGYDLPAFDFDSFALSDILTHGSHVALDQLAIVYQDPPTGIPEIEAPTRMSLRRVSPNPFRDETTLTFDLAADTSVELAIFAVDGRRVATLISGSLPAGTHSVRWDGNDERGNHLADGIYLARLKAAGRVTTRTLLRLR